MEEYNGLCDMLWAKTQEDWCIKLSNLLTEPTCFVVNVLPENEDSKYKGVVGFLGNRDPMESSINAMKHVLEKLDGN